MDQIPEGLKRARHELAVEKTILQLLASLPEGARLRTLYRVEADADQHEQPKRDHGRSDVILNLLSDGNMHGVGKIAMTAYGEENAKNNNRVRSLLAHLKKKGVVEQASRGKWRLVEKTTVLTAAPAVANVAEEPISNEPALPTPAKTATPHKDESIHIRCTAEQKEAIEQSATRDGLTISGWLLMLGLREAKLMKASKLTVVKG